MLALALAAVTAATVVLLVRALRAWRSFKSLARKAGRAVADVEARTARAEARARQLADGGVRLAEATQRLEGSLSTLAVLRSAAGEFRNGVARVRGIVPQK